VAEQVRSGTPTVPVVAAATAKQKDRKNNHDNQGCGAHGLCLSFKNLSEPAVQREKSLFAPSENRR
jgi:hypothetical protein